MNEELQTSISELISKSISAIDGGTDFLSDEIPDFVHQLLLWHGAYNFLFFLLGVAMIGLIPKLTSLVKKQSAWVSKDRPYGNRECSYVLTGLSAILYVILIFSSLNLTWLQILIAPKVFLVEYAAKLI